MNETAMDTQNQDVGRQAADKTETYLLQIRNLLAWILILMVLSIVGGVIAGIVIGTHSGQQAAITCQYQGGTDPSC